ncbi:MAG: TlyA family RNA methyltransferase [bacterium]|jgi:23S rRNA (cytidine1920-2'-O)/16S rRNA (cytidine1409-2'-O)-methyltransferase|nr:TlyA family RNA methyltransferase [bacterium]
MKKVRLDLRLVQDAFFPSREAAQRYIRAGKVLVDEVVIDKPGALIDPVAPLRVQRQETEFAGRGGEKLEGALAEFGIAVRGLIAADLGASTGGFTDCLLKRGVQKVFAVDVGRGQLVYRLQTDPRVVVMDNTNCRYLEARHLGGPVDLVVADLSFISIKTVYLAIQSILKPEGQAVLLIKPQFEVGKGKVGKKGLVRHQEDHEEVLLDFYRFFREAQWAVRHIAPSIIQGKTGNIEFLIHVMPNPLVESIPPEAVLDAVGRAHRKENEPR